MDRTVDEGMSVAADWNGLADYLRDKGDRVTLTWEQLDGLVGGLPASAVEHQAFWSGDRPHRRAWQRAGYELESVQRGSSLVLRRRRPAGAATEPVAPAEPAELSEPDLLLVTCVKTKLDVPAAAKDLYRSPLFAKMRAYAEGAGLPWYILSAEHGLVLPDEWLSPYERYLPATPSGYRKTWGHWVAARLALVEGDLRGRTIEVHASHDYIAAIEEPLSARGALLWDRLEGLGMGQRLAWYDADRPAATPIENDVARLVSRLSDQSMSMSPSELLDAPTAELAAPGLYSWWVDRAGAADLAKGLGHPVEPGLIYAGQAGATRWPSGRRSGNTLGSRLIGMHLGKRAEFSTFRKTLGAVLRAQHGWMQIDEAELTRWMHAHLRVVPVPVPDADGLGRLEEAVLAELDPPLNLRGMAPTGLRARLRGLRRGV